MHPKSFLKHIKCRECKKLKEKFDLKKEELEQKLESKEED